MFDNGLMEDLARIRGKELIEEAKSCRSIPHRRRRSTGWKSGLLRSIGFSLVSLGTRLIQAGEPL